MSVARIDRERQLAALDALLTRVEKPTRYVGGEWNSVTKDLDRVELSMVLGFPDIYEIGMSHLGYRILYALLNARDEYCAERVFMPWSDMLALLRERDLPLVTLESRRPLRDFDLVGFSMQSELTITNVLAMLDLGGIPLTSAERGESDPLVLMGGPVIFNPEPFADFADAILVGDAEEALPRMMDTLRDLKRQGASRLEKLRAIARIGGWYVPSLYDVAPEPVLGMLIARPKPGEDVPRRVKRALVLDLDQHPFPAKIIVPHQEIVHDRVSWEVMRGCPVGCRFCQAGYVYRPTRERDPAEVAKGVRESLRETGYDEFSLNSLNTGEYGPVEPLMTSLMDECEPEMISVSTGSLHASTMTETLATQLKRVRKSGFTMAPEAGSQRLRNVINKNLSEEQILEACRLAFVADWKAIKLYFMLGLPTETLDDVLGIADLSGKILGIGRRLGGRRVTVTSSASTFIPKPFTPFQWFGMATEPDVRAKQDALKRAMPRGVEFKHHPRAESWLEGVLSRADRSVAPAIRRAYEQGAVLDAWGEHLKLDVWREAFAALGIDADALATRDIPLEAELPWEIVDPEIRRKWLEHEFKRALAEKTVDICGADSCAGCAPFAKECIHGIVGQKKWTDYTPASALPALPTLPTLGAPGATAAHAEALAACAAPAAALLGEQARLASASTAHASAPATATAAVSVAVSVAVAEPAAADGSPAPDAAETPARAEAPVYRYRARFRKEGRARFLGHLDLVRALAQSFRRAGVRLDYSAGFKPKPKMSLSPALALGIASREEFLDFEVRTRLEAEDFLPRINASLPEGLTFTALVAIDGVRTSLQEAIRRARYHARVFDVAPEALRAHIEAFAASETCEIVREGKKGKRTFDLKTIVDDIDIGDDGTLRFTIRVGQEGSARPGEVLAALLPGIDASDVALERVSLLAEIGGRLVSPLLARA